jgi:hypothetical protein
MVLCPNHHGQARAAMPEVEQREHKAAPFNQRQRFANGMLYINHDACAIDVGGVLLVGEGPSVTLDGETVLSLAVEDGRLKLSMTVYDATDTLLAEIVDNEWITGDPTIWDMEAKWQLLKLNVGPRKIALRIDARRQPLTLRAELWRHGVHVRLLPSGVYLPQTRNAITQIGLVNMPLVVDTTTGLQLGGGAGSGDGFLVFQADPLRRLVMSLEALSEVTTGRKSLILNPTAP